MIPTIQEIKQGWSSYAKVYSQIAERSSVQLGLSLARMLQIHKAKNILEVGCGTGILTVNLLQSLPIGIKYLSVDIADEMIKLAEQRKLDLASKLNDIDHKFLIADAEDLSFLPNESIDAYISSLCLQLTPDPDKALKEALRVLNKGGKIGFSVLGNYERNDYGHIFYDTFKEFGVISPPRRSIYRFGDREALIKLAQYNGIEVDFCWVESVVFEIFDDDDVEFLNKAPSVSKTLSQVDEEVRLKIVQAMKEKLRERKKNFMPVQIENALLVGRKPE